SLACLAAVVVSGITYQAKLTEEVEVLFVAGAAFSTVLSMLELTYVIARSKDSPNLSAIQTICTITMILVPGAYTFAVMYKPQNQLPVDDTIFRYTSNHELRAPWLWDRLNQGELKLLTMTGVFFVYWVWDVLMLRLLKDATSTELRGL